MSLLFHCLCTAVGKFCGVCCILKSELSDDYFCSLARYECVRRAVQAPVVTCSALTLQHFSRWMRKSRHGCVQYVTSQQSFIDLLLMGKTVDGVLPVADAGLVFILECKLLITEHVKVSLLVLQLRMLVIFTMVLDTNYLTCNEVILIVINAKISIIPIKIRRPTKNDNLETKSGVVKVVTRIIVIRKYHVVVC